MRKFAVRLSSEKFRSRELETCTNPIRISIGSPLALPCGIAKVRFHVGLVVRNMNLLTNVWLARKSMQIASVSLRRREKP